MLRRYTLPFLPWYIAGTVALIATNALAVAIPLVLADGVDALASGSPERVPALAARAVLMAGGVLAVRTLSRLAFFTPGRLVEARVKADLIQALLRHQPAFVRRFPPAEVVSRAANDVNQVRLLTGFAALQAVNAVVAVVMVLGQVARVAPVLAVWVLVPVGIGVLLTMISVRRVFVLIRVVQEALAALSDQVLTSFQGIATVQTFAAEGAFLRWFDRLNLASLEASLRRANQRAATGPLLGMAGSVSVFLLLWFGGPLAMSGEVTIGELVAFTTLVAYLVEPLRSVSFLVAIVKEAQAALGRAAEILDPPPDRPDLPDPRPAPRHAPAIVVEDLRFSWPGAPRPALDGVSFEVPAGALVGVVGPTGAGKSTLLQVLARLYNPPPGAVRVDGVDVRRVDLDAWREAATLVPQRPVLFSDSILENVLLGRSLEAGQTVPRVDQATVDAALRDAAMEVDLATLPAGLATRVGEDGVMLSGGQRQRVALARAWVREPVVLLLDDVLSAVDLTTERWLLEAMAARRTHRVTTLLVAHRLTAVRQADRIVVLEGGRVTAVGTHDELLAIPGFYRETWRRQAEADDAG